MRLNIEDVLTINEPEKSFPLGDKLDTWAVGFDPHPALHDLVINQLLRMANSTSEAERFLAVCNRDLPKAQLVMMQGDESERVREIVARILAYEECE